MKKRILTVLLAVCLVFALGTVTALADDTLPDPVNGVITLNQAYNLGTTRVEIPESVSVIDLNGYTITGLLKVTHQLTIRDTSAEHDGEIVAPSNDDNLISTIFVEAGGNLTIESGTIRACEGSVQGAIRNMGTLTINGGTVTGAYGIRSGAQFNRDPIYTDVSLTINNGTVHGDEYAIYTFGRGITNGDVTKVDNEQVTLTITGGRIESDTGVAIGTNASSGAYAGYTLTMTGGEVEGGSTAMYLPAIGVNNISGGTITGEQAIRIASGELNITGGTLISDGNSTDDIIAAEPGGASGALVIGKAGTGYVGDLIVNVSGRARLENSTDGANRTAVYVTDKTMDNSSYDGVVIEVNIEGIEIDGNVLRVSGDGATDTKADTTSLTIDSATVLGDVINKSERGGVTVNNSAVTGSVTATENTDGNIVVFNSNIGSTNGNGVILVDTAVGENPSDTNTGDYVAVVNGKGYESLDEAVSAANDGDTVTLLNYVNLTQTLTINGGKTLTIDLNGKNITNSNSVIEIQNAHVSFVGEGTIRETSPYYGAIVLKGSNNPQDENYTSVIIGENVTLEAWSAVFITPYQSSVAPYAYGVQADIYGTLNGVDDTSGAKGSAIYINGQIKHKDNCPVINIYPSAVLNSSGLIYAAGYAEWNIDGASISGYSAGIGAKAGVINITGNATIRCTGPNTAPTEGYSNGINGSGAAIQIESNSGYAGDVVLNIYNATIISENGYAIYEYANGSDPLNVDEINIADGTFISALDQVICVSSAMEQAGNTVLSVEGGNYSAPVPLTFLADNLNAELYSRSSTDTPYSYYRSVEEALAASQPGDVVTDLTNVAEDAADVTLTFNYGDGNIQNVTGREGATITLTVPTRNGYTFGGWRVNGGSVVPGGTVYTITADTTFTAIWNAINVPDTHNITIANTVNGTVSTNFSNASAGSTVTITAAPADGYAVSSVAVTGPDGRVNVTRVDATTYTFVMPDGAVTVSVSFGPATVTLPFTDVTTGDWFYDEVAYVYANGLMDGVSATRFDPNGTMTRAMVWAILARVDGQTVTGDNWIETARAWAMAEGVSDGENATGAVTREQLVTMLWRYAGEPAGTASLSAYTDAGSVSDWASTAMSWAIANGIIEGMSADTIVPGGTATRAQCAAILMRYVTL